MPQLDGDKNRQLTIGELSSRSGVASSVLHFYERNGLISSARTDGNQRRYSCALQNPADVLGSKGSGPIRWLKSGSPAAE